VLVSSFRVSRQVVHAPGSRPWTTFVLPSFGCPPCPVMYGDGYRCAFITPVMRDDEIRGGGQYVLP
jgi:hypothetical protein